MKNQMMDNKNYLINNLDQKEVARLSALVEGIVQKVTHGCTEFRMCYHGGTVQWIPQADLKMIADYSKCFIVAAWFNRDRNSICTVIKAGVPPGHADWSDIQGSI